MKTFRFRSFLPVATLFFLFAFMPTFAHAQDGGGSGSGGDAGAGGGGGAATIDRGSVTDLGGGSSAGAEPDIFEDAPGGDDGGKADDSAGDDGATDDGEGTPTGDEGEGDGADDDPGAGEGDDEKDDAGEDEEVDGASKTPEEKEAARKAAEAKEAAKKPALTEEEKKIEATLQEEYRRNPQLKEALKAFPKLRGEFFRAASINRVFPGGQQEAEQAKTWAMDLMKIDNLYYGNGSQSKRDFVNMLWTEALDKDGKSTGHFEQVAEIVVGDTIGNVEKYLSQNPSVIAQIGASLKPEQVNVAFEVVRRAIAIANGKPLSRGPSTTGAGAGAGGNRAALPDTTGMTPREKQLAEDLAQAKGELQRFNQTESQQTEQRFHTNVYKEFDAAVQTDLAKRLPPAIQSNRSLVTWFGKAVREELKTALEADEFLVAKLEQASRSGDRGPQHVSQLADMLKQRAQMLLPEISRRVAADFAVKPAGNRQPSNIRLRTPSNRGSERPRREPSLNNAPGRISRPADKDRSPARQSGVQKTTGDYNRDANKLLGVDD